MIKAVIVDDELYARETLELLLNRFSNSIEVVGSASSAKGGYNLISEANPDVVFLDIEMPGGSGFDMLSKFKEIPFNIIFTTAYDQYAIRAIKFSALDYILKPVSIKELEESINKLNVDSINKIDNVKNLIDSLGEKKGLKKIILPIKRDRYRSVDLNDIILIKADGSYSTFYLKKGQKIITSKIIKEYELLFENTNLVRVHKSSIVNINEVEYYQKGDGGKLQLSNGETINISRSRKDYFLSKYK